MNGKGAEEAPENAGKTPQKKTEKYAESGRMGEMHPEITFSLMLPRPNCGMNQAAPDGPPPTR
jgi:hypothetical protein